MVRLDHCIERMCNILRITCIYVEYGPAMVEHIILRANLDPGMKVASDFDCSDGKRYIIVI